MINIHRIFSVDLFKKRFIFKDKCLFNDAQLYLLCSYCTRNYGIITRNTFVYGTGYLLSCKYGINISIVEEEHSNKYLFN